MPVRYHLTLRPEQRQEFRALRDHAALPYLRERAATLLAVADGQSLRQAARRAGLKPHRVDTVCAWVHRSPGKGAGVQGLRMRQGRGRGRGRGLAHASPPPFPQAPSAVQAALQHLVGQRPDHAGLPRSRWWLDGIRGGGGLAGWPGAAWPGHRLATVWPPSGRRCVAAT